MLVVVLNAFERPVKAGERPAKAFEDFRRPSKVFKDLQRP